MEEPIVAVEPAAPAPASEAAPAPDAPLVVSLEPTADADDNAAPAWVKDVRKRNRELERELREAKKKLTEAAAPKEIQLGPKPTLEQSDYDAVKFEASLADWMEKKRVADEKAAAAAAEAQSADAKWKAKLAAFQEAKSDLQLPDYPEAENVVTDLLTQVQQSIIVHGAKNAALLVYALGKNEEEARKLAAIKDPVEFAFAVARLEERMKVEGRKPATAPEERIVASGKPSATVDSTLERLRAEAAKTGDYTKVTAYKRQHR